MPGVIEEPTGESAAQKEERKNQHEARDALRHEPARQRPEEIANAKDSRRVRKKRQARQPKVPRAATKRLRLSRAERCLAAKTRRQSWLG